MKTNGDCLNVIITGVGGQGNILASHILASAAIASDFHVTIGETYGQSQRGGAVMSHLRVSQRQQYGPLIGEGQADLIVGLEPLETLRVLSQYGNSRVVVATNSRPIYPQPVGGEVVKYPTTEEVAETLRSLAAKSWVVDATGIALELGPPILANIVMMGTLVGVGLLPIGATPFEEEMRESLPSDRLEMNLKAFRRGIQEVEGRR